MRSDAASNYNFSRTDKGEFTYESMSTGAIVSGYTKDNENIIHEKMGRRYREIWGHPGVVTPFRVTRLGVKGGVKSITECLRADQVKKEFLKTECYTVTKSSCERHKLALEKYEAISSKCENALKDLREVVLAADYLQAEKANLAVFEDFQIKDKSRFSIVAEGGKLQEYLDLGSEVNINYVEHHYLINLCREAESFFDKEVKIEKSQPSKTIER